MNHGVSAGGQNTDVIDMSSQGNWMLTGGRLDWSPRIALQNVAPAELNSNSVGAANRNPGIEMETHRFFSFARRKCLWTSEFLKREVDFRHV